MNDEITSQQDEIRPCRLGEGDHSVQLVETVEGRADMEIRQHRDTQPRALTRPLVDCQVIVLVPETGRLDPERP